MPRAISDAILIRKNQLRKQSTKKHFMDFVEGNSASQARKDIVLLEEILPEASAGARLLHLNEHVVSEGIVNQKTVRPPPHSTRLSEMKERGLLRISQRMTRDSSRGLKFAGAVLGDDRHMRPVIANGESHKQNHILVPEIAVEIQFETRPTSPGTQQKK